MIAQLVSAAARLPLVAQAPDSAAFRAGYLVGTILAVLSMIAVFVFGIIAIVKAFTQRTTGWIIAGCLSGVVIGIVGVVMMIAFARGFAQGYKQARERTGLTSSAAKQPENVTGQAIPFSIEKPAGWWLKRKEGAY